MARTFAQQSKIQAAQIDLEELLRLQIDEENHLRGYSLTRDPFYVDEYRAAASEFDVKERAIRATLENERLTTAIALLNDYAAIQKRWRAGVAVPVLHHTKERVEDIDKRNKFFSDREATTVDAIRVELADENDVLAHSTQAELDRSSYVRAFWLLLFGLLAILFNAYRTRLNRELEEERTITDVLQRAFRSESAPLPRCELGSSYLSATSHAAVGGDVFDVFRLSDTLALLSIADVSGKGVDAAVLTAFIKFTIRSIALRRRDPGSILAEFNTAFTQTVENPYLFVTMWVGVLDTETLTLKYASGGHDSAFLRRSKIVQQLPVTGPIVGVMEEPFETKQANLETGDVLVLATDGLTEARARDGSLLQEEGAMRWIAAAGETAPEIAATLAARVRELSRNVVRDDLAILVLRVVGEARNG